MNKIWDILNENKRKKRMGEKEYGPTSYHEIAVKIHEKYGEFIPEGTIGNIASRDTRTNVEYAQMIAGALDKSVEDVFPIEEKKPAEV